VFAYAVLGSALLSCANAPEEKTSVQNEMAKILAEQRATPLVVPDDVSDVLLDNSVPHSAAKIDDARFDVSVNQVPARTFFVSLVADAGVNVVAHPEVAGRISLELRDVTVKDVLDVTREVYGYEYKFTRGIYTIYPRKIRTEIFPINYLDVQRVGVTDTSVLIGKITSESSGSNSRNGGGRESSSNDEGSNLLGYLDDGTNASSSGESISPGARVQTLTKTDFWAGLNETILAIVGGDEGGRMVMTNPQSGLVVVKALPVELSAVREFLERSELSVKRQVVLETKILEVQLNDEFSTGINWGAISGQIEMTQTSNSTGSLADIVLNGNSTRESIISSVLNVTDITKLVFFLEQQGSVQVLSSPRISTVNNQKALIRVGSDQFFVTGISNSTTSSASSIVSTPEVELDSFFSGIALDVTPQISDDGDVILHIHPMVTKVQDQIKEIDIAGESFSLPLALRDVRESDSIVKAKNGQVVVLGGLMQETNSDVNTKRPFLGDVPVLNALFKAKQQSTVKTELVILMRPIVVDENTWQNQISEGARRIDLLTEESRAR